MSLSNFSLMSEEPIFLDEIVVPGVRLMILKQHFQLEIFLPGPRSDSRISCFLKFDPSTIRNPCNSFQSKLPSKHPILYQLNTKELRHHRFEHSPSQYPQVHIVLKIPIISEILIIQNINHIIQPYDLFSSQEHDACQAKFYETQFH